MSDFAANKRNLKKRLKEFGTVEEFRKSTEDGAELFNIKITTGFDPSAINTFKVLGMITKTMDDRYPYIRYHKTGKDLYHLILKQK